MEFTIELFTENMRKYADGLNDIVSKNAMRNIGYEYKSYIDVFVPKLSGDLRDNARVYYSEDSACIDYAPPSGDKIINAYAIYQNRGLVKGPNKALWGQGPSRTGVAAVQSGWTSPTKHKEYASPFRYMGTKFTKTLSDGREIHVDGYTTQGTGREWIDKFMNSRLQGTCNVRAGRYLYELFCHENGLKPNGGYVVFNDFEMWSQF